MDERFTKLLSNEVQLFIREHLDTDVHALLLKKSPFEDASVQDLAQQIKGRQVAARKLPFLNIDGIVFPPAINLEQSSSEATARYKAGIVGGGGHFVDLTAGFGIDTFFISQKFSEVSLVEQNEELIAIDTHNWKVLNRNAHFIHSTLEQFLQENQQFFQLVYLDPARRDASKRKVFLLEELSPNILNIQQQLFSLTDQILIKLSPLIDISYISEVLNDISQIHIVAVKNDVKELLVLLKKGFSSDFTITAVNLESSEPEFSFTVTEENSEAEYGGVQNFLFVPNNAVLKSGAFNLIAQRFGLRKLHPNTHLYTGNQELSDFPGRMFTVEKIKSNTIKKGERYNIISKNYPLKPDQIKKKYKIKDGGNVYLIFTEDVSGKIILKSQG